MTFYLIINEEEKPSIDDKKKIVISVIEIVLLEVYSHF